MANREQPKQYRDLLTAFPYGINSGVAPLLLPKQQASFAINATFRGGYASNRSARTKQTLNFGDDAVLEAAVREGFFQGATIYRPDFGSSQIIAQISGRIYSFTPSGDEWDVADITIAGDPNANSTNPVWMWQAEKWLIIQDGTGALPIFYDGVSCRRSYGPSQTIATTQAVGAFPNPRVIGEIVTVTLAATYDGPFDVPVIFNDALYQPAVAADGSYDVYLTNVTGTPADVIPTGTDLVIRPGALGYTTVAGTISAGTGSPTGYVMAGVGLLNVSAETLALGDSISVLGYVVQLTSVSEVGTSTILAGNVTSPTPTASVAIPIGTLISSASEIAPSYIIGALLADFTVPADSPPPSTTATVGGTATAIGLCAGYHKREFANLAVADSTGFYVGADVTVVVTGPAVSWQVSAVGTNEISLISVQSFFGCGGIDNTMAAGAAIAIVAASTGGTDTATIDQQYFGPPNQPVWLGTDQFLITAIPAIGGATLNLINLTDTTDAGAAIPAEDILSVPEIPAGRMGAYGRGQNWFCGTDGIQFGPSDLVGSSSGTPANNYRDAVLKTTDLNIMGWFRVPVSGEIITSMTFIATLDQALGQGPLQIGVPSGMFSCRAPFTLQDFQGITNEVSGDLVTAPITDPILTKSLVGFGPTGQWSTVLSNSDTIFRTYEGVSSLILARRQFSDAGGNTPISREMARTIDQDRTDLLSYCSAIVFDNRLRMTCAANVSDQGVFHMGELVLNYDLISSLRGKADPVWEGLWTGNNILKFVQGIFGNENRAFAFTFNITDSQIELYELEKTGAAYFDNGTDRIKWIIETPIIFNSDIKSLTDLARLIDGQMYLTDVYGQVDVNVLYRPIFYPCWKSWHSFKICSDMSAINAKQQVRYALGLGEPDASDCDTINNQPFREAVAFQLRIEITGHCSLWGIETLGDEIPRPRFNKPAGDCTTATPTCLPLDCDVEADLDVYSLDGLPASETAPTQVGNDFVFSFVTDSCESGTTLAVIGVPLPAWISFDSTNAVFRGAFNTYYGDTKAEANTTAQAALDAFVTNLIAAGGLVCAADALELFYDDFEDYADGVAVNGLGLGHWTNLPSPYVDI